MAAKDIPLDAPGIPWDVWYEQQVERIFSDAREKRKHVQSEPETHVSSQPVEARQSFQATSSADDQLLAIAPYDE